jgi:non-ribosomal peptide synthase protein (TIGR01720 family)
VQLADKQGIQAQIESVKRSLRAIPGGGTGYGMLAYLLDELEPADEQERIRFNYLGEIDAGLYGEWFTLTDESYGRDVSPANKLGCILDVNVHVLGGKLHGVIAYSRNVFGEEAASGLVRQWKDRLEAVIHHCTEQRPAVLAASDFEWSGLNQEELDGLF